MKRVKPGPWQKWDDVKGEEPNWKEQFGFLMRQYNVNIDHLNMQQDAITKLREQIEVLKDTVYELED